MRTLASLAALALLAPAVTRGVEAVALLPATGANVAPGELAAATDVLRAAMERTGRFVVVAVPAPAPAGAREPTAGEALDAARAAGVGTAVLLRVSRLGEVGVARVALYRDGGGAVPAHVDQLPVKGADDLEPALQRLAAGLGAGAPARGLAEIDTVTAREADPRLYRQRTASRLFGARLVSAFDLDPGDGRGRAAALSGLGVAWQYDARSFMAETALEVAWSQTLDLKYSGRRDWLLAFSLGAYYPFLRGDVAPYLGGAVAYQWGSTGADSGGSGLVLRPSAGLVLGRLSEVQVRVDAAYQVNTFEERDASGAVHRGHGPLLSVALVK